MEVTWPATVSDDGDMDLSACPAWSGHEGVTWRHGKLAFVGDISNHSSHTLFVRDEADFCLNYDERCMHEKLFAFDTCYAELVQARIPTELPLRTAPAQGPFCCDPTPFRMQSLPRRRNVRTSIPMSSSLIISLPQYTISFVASLRTC